MLYLSVKNTFESDEPFLVQKRKIMWKAYIALIFSKCPKMHENECNLAGNTIALNFSGVIHCIRFIL